MGFQDMFPRHPQRPSTLNATGPQHFPFRQGPTKHLHVKSRTTKLWLLDNISQECITCPILPEYMHWIVDLCHSTDEHGCLVNPHMGSSNVFLTSSYTNIISYKCNWVFYLYQPKFKLVLNNCIHTGFKGQREKYFKSIS